MPEPILLTTLLLAGANIVGSEVVKEATKDAYRSLKGKVIELFGPRASKAITKAEDVATFNEGREELARYVGSEFDADETAQLRPFIEAFLHTMKDDAAASRIAKARVDLDVEAGGNALIRNIENADEVAVKVRAAMDVTIEGIQMARGRDLGK